MARYLISYLDGETETVDADGVEYDPDARDYTFVKNNQAVALAPVTNVRSVVRQDDEELTRPTPRGPQPAKRLSRNPDGSVTA